MTLFSKILTSLIPVLFSSLTSAAEPISANGSPLYDFSAAHREAQQLPRLHSLLISHGNELVFEGQTVQGDYEWHKISKIEN